MENPITQGPMTVGQLFDRAFRLYRNHFWVFVGIVGIAQLFVFLGQAVAGSGQLMTIDSFGVGNSGTAIFGGLLAILGIALAIVGGLASLLAAGAVASATTRFLFNEEITIGGAYSAVRPKLGSLFILALIIGLLSVVIALWFMIPIAGWLTGLGLLIFFSVVGAMSVPALVLENGVPSDSMRRMWTLAQKHFWPVIGFSLLIGLLSYILVGGLAAVIGFASAAFTATNPPLSLLLLVQIGQAALTAILSTFVTPITLIAYTLLYLDLRVRAEGFDLTVASSQGEPSYAVLNKTPPLEKEPLFPWPFIQKLMLLNLPFLVIVCGLIGIVAAAGAAAEGIFNSFPIN